MTRFQESTSDIGCPVINWPSAAAASSSPTSICDTHLPTHGRSWDEVRAELIARKADDYDWRAGRLPIYVYHDDDELLAVSRDSYSLYFSENALGQRAFPSLARMEAEIVSMALALFEAPTGSAGTFTSGGTESLFLAMKSARGAFREKQGRHVRPRAVLPRTAHPAFDKAAEYLDVDVVRVDTGPDFRCDVRCIKEVTDERTMLIAASAPCYPYGVYDPIDAIGEFALARGLWLHVDACLGGFLAPFARDEGFPIPAFEFSVPGVSSLSADLHKYGFSARGASVILYRSEELKAYQGFHFQDWPRGSYATETFQGSRPGGAIASAWAVTQYLGRSGYRRLARKTLEAKLQLAAGINAINGLTVLYPSDLSILLYTSTDDRLDLNAVADGMSARGWFVGRSREPLAIHLALNAVHARAIGSYLEDLKVVVEEVQSMAVVGIYDDSTY